MKRADYKELTKQINEVKRELQDKPVTFKYLKQIFGENNLPTYNNFLRAFARKYMNRNGLLWEFKDKNPIYYKTIEGLYQSQNQYQSKYKKTSKTTEIVQIVDKEQESIDYLKSLGYKIFRVVQTLEEV